MSLFMFQTGLRNIVRNMSSSPSVQSVGIKKVSPKLTLRTLDVNSDKSNALVLFFPWLNATSSAIDKYCNLYHDRKMDVLCVDVQLKHFLRPSTGRLFAVEILDYLKDHSPQDSKFIVHAFSIGAYLYSVVLMELERNRSVYGGVGENICGQVFDSITVGGLKRMREGIAGVTQSALLKAILKTSTSAYFALTKKYTVDFYEEAIDQFVYKPIQSPVLFFYCLNDPMASSESMQEIIDLWKDDSKYTMDVWVKCWENSSHAGQLRRYPDEYVQTLQDFLIRIGQFKPGVTKSNL